MMTTSAIPIPVTAPATVPSADNIPSFYPVVPRPRTNGALLTMPIIIFNMGTEMIYILQQRIKAQEIPADKARKVIADVLKAMFAPTFIDELFRPQELYRFRDTRTVFERLAHASIMRLNKTSMDKLMDLMTMGFKYQISSVSSPTHILQITLNHIEALQNACDDPHVNQAIQITIIRIIDTYSRLPLGELFALKYACVRFVQNRLVKVSVFMEENIQSADGVILLDTSGPLPPGTDPLGTIKYFTYNPTDKRRNETVVKIPSLPLRGTFSKPEGNPLDPKTRECKLGTNLYLKERKKGANDTLATNNEGKTNNNEKNISSSTSPGKTTAGPTVAMGDGKEDDDNDDTNRNNASTTGNESKEETSTTNGNAGSTKRTGLASVNLLASLLGGATATTNASTITANDFQFNLFADDGFGFNGSNSSYTTQANNTVTFQQRQDTVSSATSMLNALGFNDNASSHHASTKQDSKEDIKEEENDLLDLLDSL